MESTIVNASTDTAQVLALVAAVVFAGSAVIAGMGRAVAVAGVASGLAASRAGLYVPGVSQK